MYAYSVIDYRQREIWSDAKFHYHYCYQWYLIGAVFNSRVLEDYGTAQKHLPYFIIKINVFFNRFNHLSILVLMNNLIITIYHYLQYIDILSNASRRKVVYVKVWMLLEYGQCDIFISQIWQDPKSLLRC